MLLTSNEVAVGVVPPSLTLCELFMKVSAHNVFLYLLYLLAQATS